MFNLVDKLKLLSNGISVSNATEQDAKKVIYLPTPKIAEKIEASILETRTSKSHKHEDQISLVENTDFIKQYLDLLQITQQKAIEPDKIEDSYSYHPSNSIFITDNINQICSLFDLQSTPLKMDHNLGMLQYNDYKKIALAKLLFNITSIVIKNHLNKDFELTNEVPELASALENCTSLSKRDGLHISCSKEDFRAIEKIVAENIQILYPNAASAIHQSYEINNALEDTSDHQLTDYQFYCLLNGLNTIPHTGYKSINDDIKAQNQLYNYAVKLILAPIDKEEEAKKMKDLTGRSFTISSLKKSV